MREIALEDDYKRLTIEGYTNYIEKNKDVILDEQERDYRMGARAIVLEEFVLSIFGFPHIIALPSKAAVYVLSRISYETYFRTPRHPTFGFEIWTLQSESFTMFYNNSKNEVKPNEDTLNNFYHIQLNCLYVILSIVIIVVEQWAFMICYVDLMALKIFSYGTSTALTAVVVARPNIQLDLWMYFSQLVVTLILLITKIVILVSPFMFSYKYTSYTVLGCLFGPAYINLIFYLILYANILTDYKYFAHFPHFRPHLAGRFLLEIFNSGLNIGALIFNALSKIAKGGYGAFKQIIRSLRVFLPKGQLFTLYKQILIASGHQLKDLGYLGDLVYTPIVLVWIFWPLTIPYVFENWFLVVPSFPVTVFLLIKGYSVAKEIWNDKQD